MDRFKDLWDFLGSTRIVKNGEIVKPAVSAVLPEDEEPDDTETEGETKVSPVPLVETWSTGVLESTEEG